MRNSINLFQDLSWEALSPDFFSESLTECIPAEILTDRSLVKWKSRSNQVVLKGSDYYYKIYWGDAEGNFDLKLNTILALSDIYNSWGIEWDVKTVRNGNMICVIEKRQPLEVLTPDHMSLEEIFAQWGKTQQQLNEIMEINRLSLQLRKQSGGSIHSVVLGRKCLPKYNDYAIFNGKVVLLDDADFLLFPKNKNGSWANPKMHIYEVEFFDKTLWFMPTLEKSDNELMIDGESHRYWDLYYPRGESVKLFEQESLDLEEQLIYQSMEIMQGNLNIRLNPKIYEIEDFHKNPMLSE